MNNADRIGYLVAYPSFTGVCCQECLDAADKDTEKSPVPLYRVNVGPYKQTCHGCGKALVEPKTALWPELFVKTSLTTTNIDSVAATVVATAAVLRK